MEDRIDWIAVAEGLTVEFAERAADHDGDDSFVAENYGHLRESRLPSALIPAELGGGGASYAEYCDVLRILGRGCASTALALSMHSHLVAAAVYKYHHGMGGEPLLRAVAEGERILVSTGATDWVDSNGRADKVEGGWRVSGRKVFGSGSPGADMLITSIAWEDDPEGPGVLHFPVPFSAPGVTRLDDWHTLGMRGTGSHTVLFEDVFVPEEAVVLRRPQGRWHKATVERAMEVAGGASFYRAFPFERLWRDAQASHYHPLPEKRQLEFSGRVGLGLSPVVERESAREAETGVAPKAARVAVAAQ